MLLAAYGKRSIPVGKAEIIRAQKLETLKFTSFDALHIACAERGKADVFLTTDDKLLRVASRHADKLRTRVENPLTWLRGGEKI
jgi:predicted nucleic acid-binding protein